MNAIELEGLRDSDLRKLVAEEEKTTIFFIWRSFRGEIGVQGFCSPDVNLMPGSLDGAPEARAMTNTEESQVPTPPTAAAAAPPRITTASSPSRAPVLPTSSDDDPRTDVAQGRRCHWRQPRATRP